MRELELSWSRAREWGLSPQESRRLARTSLPSAAIMVEPDRLPLRPLRTRACRGKLGCAKHMTLWFAPASVHVSLSAWTEALNLHATLFWRPFWARTSLDLGPRRCWPLAA